MGLTFDNVTVAGAVADLIAAAKVRRRSRVVFANAHVLNCTATDPAYRRTVASADMIYADGSGLAIAARLAGRALADNVNGTDLLPLLAAAAQKASTGIFLLGGAPGRAQASLETLAGLGHGRAMAGAHHGFIAPGSAAEQSVIDTINASGAAIVLVGMGVPLQDQWIERNAHRIDAPVLIGVGGLFDFFSGSVTRAPAILRAAGLEWCWRLAQEPRRMWRRYIIGNVRFLARACRHAMICRRDAGTIPATASSRPVAH